MDYDVIVIGAGAAGLVGAERSAARGRRTLLLEKNRKPGVKILISGGTRCNLTHATDARGIVEAFGTQGRFLHSALAALGPAELIALVEGEGVATKVEETGKVFPVSNHATDILGAFMDRLRRTPCEIALEEPVEAIERLDISSALDRATSDGDVSAHAGFRVVTPKRTLTTEKLIITVGGKSYPGCGTRGDGYGWAKLLGHTIVATRPALVPLLTDEEWVRDLKGITISDVHAQVVMGPSVMDGLGIASAVATDSTSSEQTAATLPRSPKTAKARPLAERRGSFLFTHFGLSGPVVLDVSRAVTSCANPRSLLLQCDLLPDVSAGAIDEQLKQAAAAEGRKPLSALIDDRLPRRLVESLLARAGLLPTLRVAELSKTGRADLIGALKQLRISLTGSRGFEKAEVTAGGVALDEVDSRTLQSKLVPNLYWAGEVLDLDGWIGGYNFQAAFSTGWLAGSSV